MKKEIGSQCEYLESLFFFFFKKKLILNNIMK